MKIYKESSLEDFKAWSGAVATKERILEEGKAEDFERLIEEQHPDGLSETELNDILWYDDEWIYDMLEMTSEEGEDTEEETEEYYDNSIEYGTQEYLDGKHAIKCNTIEECESLDNLIMLYTNNAHGDCKDKVGIHYWANGGINVVKEEYFNKDIKVVELDYWMEH